MKTTNSPGSEVTPEPPRLRELLAVGGIHHDVSAGTKEQLLATLVARLGLEPEVRQRLVHALLAREALGATGIGNGVAIPHAAPDAVEVARPLIALALPKRRVDWGAMDGSPVGIVFLALSSDTRLHLRILARIGYVLRDAALRDLLVARASPDAILDRIDAVERARDDRVRGTE